MEVKDFVRNTLEDIVQAVEMAQDKYGKNINPEDNVHWTHSKPQMIKFDMAVTVEETNKDGVDGKIKILGSGINGRLESQISNGSHSRIQFEIPVFYPTKESYR